MTSNKACHSLLVIRSELEPTLSFNRLELDLLLLGTGSKMTFMSLSITSRSLLQLYVTSSQLFLIDWLNSHCKGTKFFCY